MLGYSISHEDRAVDHSSAFSQELAPMLRAIVDESIWPIALVDAQGLLLAASQRYASLFGSTPAALQGQPIDSARHQRTRQTLVSSITKALQSQKPVRRHAWMRDLTGHSFAADIDVIPISELCGREIVSIILRENPYRSRQEQLLLTVSTITTQMLEAYSSQQVIQHISEEIHTLGLDAAIGLLQQDGQRLILKYHTTNSILLGNMVRETAAEAISLRIPEAFFDLLQNYDQPQSLENPLSLIRHVLSPSQIQLLETSLRVHGIRHCLVSPLRHGQQMLGMLLVWGPALDDDYLPFITAISSQIIAVLSQVELRQQMSNHIRRRDSLEATARAVISVAPLEETLRIICTQAQHLLTAEVTFVALPDLQQQLFSIIVSPESFLADVPPITVPIANSTLGEVFHSNTGLLLDNCAEATTILEQYHDRTGFSAILQPLIHQKNTLGVIVALHPVIGHYQPEDLTYLNRYAAMAAIAIANAQLLNRLQFSEQQSRALMEEAIGVRSYLNTLINTTPNILLTIARDLSLTALNPRQLTELTGFQVEDIAGKSFLDFVAPTDRQRLLHDIQHIYQGEPRSSELEILNKQGDKIILFVTASLVLEYDQIFVIASDVTQQRRLEQQLRQSEKLAAQGRLIAGAAHELNNPLAIILGLTQLQLQEPLPTTSLSDLRYIEQAALRAGHIVHQLRIFAHPPTTQPQPVQIAELIEDIMHRIQEAVFNHELTVEVNLPSNLPTIQGDPHQLSQAIFNIFDNAIQSLQTSPRQPRLLTFTAKSSPEQMVLQITDNGDGIAAEHLSRIFEPFYTTRVVGQGMGLGLAITHTIIEQHSGKILATSIPHVRTTFLIELPIYGNSKLEPQPTPPEQALPPRILLIDDAEESVTMTARALTQLQYHVETVANLEQAFQQILGREYQLVISNSQLLDLPDAELYHQVRRLSPQLHWILLARRNQVDEAQRFAKRNNLSLLIRPFTRTQLISCIDAALDN